MDNENCMNAIPNHNKNNNFNNDNEKFTKNHKPETLNDNMVQNNDATIKTLHIANHFMIFGKCFRCSC